MLIAKIRFCTSNWQCSKLQIEITRRSLLSLIQLVFMTAQSFKLSAYIGEKSAIYYLSLTSFPLQNNAILNILTTFVLN